MSSSFPPTTLLLTFLFLFLRLLTLTTFVSCDTQMCRRFSRTAETTPVPPTNTSCIRAQLTPGPRYNSLIIYVEISRKSRECAVPKDHPFYLSLQVINEHGYPVGDPKEGFTQSNTPETSCDPPPPDITSHYAKDGEFKMIPCFFDYEYSHKYRQNVSRFQTKGNDFQLSITLLINCRRARHIILECWLYSNQQRQRYHSISSTSVPCGI